MTVFVVQTSLALSFDTEQEHCRDYVVAQLVTAIRANEKIVLIQNRRLLPDWEKPPKERTGEFSSRDASLLGLLLGVASPVEFLKGSISARVQGCALFYAPSAGKVVQVDGKFSMTSRENGKPIFYLPNMRSDGKCYLVFVSPQREPLKDQVWNVSSRVSYDTVDRDNRFVEDAHTLPPTEFMAKYNLTQVFSNSVYSITPGCMFLVDYPGFKPVDEKIVDNRDYIFLSQQEVSEIVYLAYLEEDKKGGAATYAEAVRQSRILQPIPKAEFKTLIGQRLHAALSDPEYGMAEKRAQEEKERQQRELAEQIAKLRTEIEMRMDAIEKAKQATVSDFDQLGVLVRQFYTSAIEEGKTDLYSIARAEVNVRHLKLIMSKHENVDQDAHASTAWFLIKGFLKDPHIQVNYAEQYDAILRKVQELPLDPEQVKEFEDAVAEMEANRKKYAR